MVPVRGNHDSFHEDVLVGYNSLWGAYYTGFEVMGSYPTYYSFDYKGDHFAVIENSIKTDEEVVDWLEEDVSAAASKGASRIFVIGQVGIMPGWPVTAYPSASGK